MEQTVTNEQQLEIDGIQNINISCKDTNIALFKSDGSSVIIKEYKSIGRRIGPFNMDKSGDVLNITEGKAPLFFGAVRYTTEIYLPATFTGNVALKIGTGNVQLNDHFTFNAFTVESSDGHIRVNEVTARSIKLQTSSGKVQCGTIHGDIEIYTKDGGIFVDKLNGNICANAKSGKIQCTVAKPMERIMLTAGDGGITLNIPQNLYFRFSAKTSGRIKTPFMGGLSRPAADNHTYQGVIGEENRFGNEATDITIAVKDYKIAVNWID